MKTVAVFLTVLTCVLLLVSGAAQAQREWELYDDFDSGVIREDLWDMEDAGALFSVENGRLRIEQIPGSPGVPNVLRFKRSPGAIKSVRARVSVASCAGDVRVRISGYTGRDTAGNPVRNALVIDCGRGLVFGKAVAEQQDADESGSDLYVLTKIVLQNPVELAGKTFTLTITFQPGMIQYAVDNMGKSLYMPFPKLLPADLLSKGIGIKSESGEGTAVIYVDDVYVSSY